MVVSRSRCTSLSLRNSRFSWMSRCFQLPVRERASEGEGRCQWRCAGCFELKDRGVSTPDHGLFVDVGVHFNVRVVRELWAAREPEGSARERGQ